MVLGVVLGFMIEIELSPRPLVLSNGDPTTFIRNPISAGCSHRGRGARRLAECARQSRVPAPLKNCRVAAGRGAAAVPAAAGETVGRLFLDVSGICVARVKRITSAATLASVDRGGACTAIGHDGGFDGFGGGARHGTAAHGEDLMTRSKGDPFMRGPWWCGAACRMRARGLGGDRLLSASRPAAELMCLSLVAPKPLMRPDFIRRRSLCARPPQEASARRCNTAPCNRVGAGIAGSMASGIIEYLAEGTSTKRMHAGWAAQSACAPRLMARGRLCRPTHGARGRSRVLPRVRAIG